MWWTTNSLRALLVNDNQLTHPKMYKIQKYVSSVVQSTDYTIPYTYIRTYAYYYETKECSLVSACISSPRAGQQILVGSTLSSMLQLITEQSCLVRSWAYICHTYIVIISFHEVSMQSVSSIIYTGILFRILNHHH